MDVNKLLSLSEMFKVAFSLCRSIVNTVVTGRRPLFECYGHK